MRQQLTNQHTIKKKQLKIKSIRASMIAENLSREVDE